MVKLDLKAKFAKASTMLRVIVGQEGTGSKHTLADILAASPTCACLDGVGCSDVAVALRWEGAQVKLFCCLNTKPETINIHTIHPDRYEDVWVALDPSNLTSFDTFCNFNKMLNLSKRACFWCARAFLDTRKQAASQSKFVRATHVTITESNILRFACITHVNDQYHALSDFPAISHLPLMKLVDTGQRCNWDAVLLFTDNHPLKQAPRGCEASGCQEVATHMRRLADGSDFHICSRHKSVRMPPSRPRKTVSRVCDIAGCDRRADRVSQNTMTPTDGTIPGKVFFECDIHLTDSDRSIKFAEIDFSKPGGFELLREFRDRPGGLSIDVIGALKAENPR